MEITNEAHFYGRPRLRIGRGLGASTGQHPAPPAGNISRRNVRTRNVIKETRRPSSAADRHPR